VLIYSVSQNFFLSPWGFWNFSPRLRIFKQNFIPLLYVHIYAELQNFIQLSLNLTKLCHINNRLKHSIYYNFWTANRVQSKYFCIKFISSVQNVHHLTEIKPDGPVCLMLPAFITHTHTHTYMGYFTAISSFTCVCQWSPKGLPVTLNVM